MTTHFNNKTFKEALSSLSIPQQRQVAARFIEKVLDLADERCLNNIVKLFSRQDVSAEDLEAAHRRAHSIYVETHPHSDLTELNFIQQGKHFVAEACMTCVAPVYEEAKVCHLAQKVAMYCRMARLYANMDHEEESPDFSRAEALTKRSIEEQYAVLRAFLDNG